ncbi:MAG: hypothetical protein H0W83_08915 [Planctomycetes bacterium]|nr:hypothetical protein [Planctomycetota bacterium]
MRLPIFCRATLSCLLGLSAPAALVAGDAAAPPGIVSAIKVLSDKVEDVSDLESWKKTYITDGMTDQEKAIAIWKTVVKYRHQDTPPNEAVAFGENVHDPLKTIHVYGYGQCCCASSNIEGLARYIGLKARGRIINAHSVPEIFYDDAWHLFDASLMNYFVKPDGKVASVDEIRHAVMEWLGSHGDLRGNDNKLRAFAKDGGWKNGPPLLASSTFYDKDGINGAGWHGWPSNMQEYDFPDDKAGVFEYGPSMGYQLNIQLRQGEKLTRNWSNKGMNVPGDPADELMKDRKYLGVQAKMGDIAPGRVGNGTLVYDLPLATGAFRGGALVADNLATTSEDKAAPALHAKDVAKPGVLVVRMPSSYVYLGGELAYTAVIGGNGSVTVSFSDNQGLDWKEISKATAAGDQKVDLKPLNYLRYDYRLKFEISGANTGLAAVKISNDILHAQTPLPALDAGKNTITFATGAQEGTITEEGCMNPDACKGKQLSYLDFHPVVKGLAPGILGVGETGAGDATFTIATPGDMTRLRMNAHWRARDAKDSYDVSVSFDDGKTFKEVEHLTGPTVGITKYFTVTDIPAGTKQAQIRLTGHQRNTTCLFDWRMAADYKEPNGGFRPVKVTYTYDENGKTKQDVHIAKQATDTWAITCDGKPLMKSIVLELAE